MKKEITQVIEKYRTEWKNRFPNSEFVEPEYDFIGMIMNELECDKQTALNLNYIANCESGRC